VIEKNENLKDFLIIYNENIIPPILSDKNWILIESEKNMKHY